MKDCTHDTTGTYCAACDKELPIINTKDKQMNKFYWSDIKNETWHNESDTLTYLLVPKKWWSIKHWEIAIDFSKNIQIFFMRKVSEK